MSDDRVHRTEMTQPAIYAVGYALAGMWRSWGVQPWAVLGHSVGELVAAAVAGMISPYDGARLAAARGRLMQQRCRPGAMAAVMASASVVEPLLAAYGEDAALAAVNGPDSVVVSGDPAAVAAIRAALDRDGVRTRLLPVSHAFHSATMDPMLDEFEELAATLTYHAPRVTFVSTVTAAPWDAGAPMTARYWRDHARRPVLFGAGVRWLAEAGATVLLEAGPAPVLLGLARGSVPESCALVPSLRPRHDAVRTVMDGAGALFVQGADVDWAAVDAGRGRRDVPLPTYPFQRRTYWLNPTSPAASTRPDVQGDGGAGRTRASDPEPVGSALHPVRISSPLASRQFALRLSAAADPWLAEYVADGAPVVRAGAYLEVLRAGWAALHGNGLCQVDGYRTTTDLRLRHETDLPGELVIDPDGRWSFHVEQAVPDGPPRWRRCAQGTVRPAMQPGSDGVDVAEVLGRLRAEVSPDEFYDRMWRQGRYLGTSMRLISRIWTGPGEVLAQLQAPARVRVVRDTPRPGRGHAADRAGLPGGNRPKGPRRPGDGGRAFRVPGLRRGAGGLLSCGQRLGARPGRGRRPGRAPARLCWPGHRRGVGCQCRYCK